MSTKFTRRRFLKIAVAGSLIAAGGISGVVYLFPKWTSTKVSTTSSQTYPIGSGPDYQTFIAPNLAKIELLRSNLMQPFSSNPVHPGYDPTLGLMAGDHFCGGWNFGATLMDPNLTIGIPLDYWNSLKGIKTSIEATARSYLKRQFVQGTCPDGTGYIGSPYSYQNDDRREFLFGNRAIQQGYFGSLPSCVRSTANPGDYGFISGDSSALPSTLSIEMESVDESGCAFTPSAGNIPPGTSLPDFACYVNAAYLAGFVTEAKTAFLQASAAWNDSTQSFASPFTGNPLAAARNGGFFLTMARGTGFWALDSTQTAIATQVSKAIWSCQDAQGNMHYGVNGSGTVGPEEAGMTLISHDPRLPSWFV